MLRCRVLIHTATLGDPMSRSSAEDKMTPSPYISPRELATRWRCSRSTVDRIARREEFTRMCLGIGDNGIIRYLMKEVTAYEQDRQIGLQN